jgi:hypothetical protein
VFGSLAISGTYRRTYTPSGSNALSPSPATGTQLDPEDLGCWVKLLNVDAPGPAPEVTNRVTAFERDWAKGHTYKRWAHYGTLYGFNYHAGAMLSGPSSEPPTWLHFRQQYLDAALNKVTPASALMYLIFLAASRLRKRKKRLFNSSQKLSKST